MFCKADTQQLPVIEEAIEVPPAKQHYDFLFKIVITGDCNAGKSHILQHFLTGQFDEIAPTVGVEFASKVVELKDGKLINL